MPRNRHIIPEPVMWMILCILLAYSVLNTIRHIHHSPNNDLRNRVVGARLMAAKQSAYFHKWQNGEPEQWLDPFEKQNQVVNGNTVTPVTLAVFSWMNGMKYRTILTLWIVLCFTCFLGCLVMAQRLLRTYQRPAYLLLLPAILLASAAWKIHLYSGQIYIVYTLLLLLFFYEMSLEKYYAAALLAVLLVAMRPPVALLFLPVFLYRFDKRLIMGSLLGLGILAVLHITIIPSTAWPDYFRSMNIHAQELPGHIPEIPVTSTPVASPEGIAMDAEGRDKYLQALSPDILSVQKIMIQNGFLSTSLIFPAILLLVFAALLLAVMGKKSFGRMSLADALLAGFVLYMLSEYFLPAPRFTYNFVQWLFALTVLACGKTLKPDWKMYMLFAGLLLNIAKLPLLPDSYSVGELLMLVALCGYLRQTEKNGEKKTIASKFAHL